MIEFSKARVYSVCTIIFNAEDVLSVLYAENDSNNTSTISDKKNLRSYRDGITSYRDGVSFQGLDHMFFGSLSRVVADNLAAHAQGGFFCNFLTVQRFCRFCNCRKNELHENLSIKNFVLRNKWDMKTTYNL